MARPEKPELAPDLPVEDRILLAVLWRFAIDARKAGDMPARIRAEKALKLAQGIAADIPYAADGAP